MAVDPLTSVLIFAAIIVIEGAVVIWLTYTWIRDVRLGKAVKTGAVFRQSGKKWYQNQRLFPILHTFIHLTSILFGVAVLMNLQATVLLGATYGITVNTSYDLNPMDYAEEWQRPVRGRAILAELLQLTQGLFVIFTNICLTVLGLQPAYQAMQVFIRYHNIWNTVLTWLPRILVGGTILNELTKICCLIYMGSVASFNTAPLEGLYGLLRWNPFWLVALVYCTLLWVILSIMFYRYMILYISVRNRSSSTQHSQVSNAAKPLKERDPEEQFEVHLKSRHTMIQLIGMMLLSSFVGFTYMITYIANIGEDFIELKDSLAQFSLMTAVLLLRSYVQVTKNLCKGLQKTMIGSTNGTTRGGVSMSRTASHLRKNSQVSSQISSQISTTG